MMTVGEGKTWRRPASDWDYSLTEAETLGSESDLAWSEMKRIPEGWETIS